MNKRLASLVFATTPFVVACGSAPPVPTPPSAPAPTVTRIAGTESDVNAYLITDGQGAIVIDATRNSRDARGIAAQVQAATSGPVTVLVTHGHPDHFLGLGALRAALPAARFVVSRPEVRDDIIGMATWMTAQGWMAKEPQMVPRDAAHPDGFDYAAELEVLAAPQLTLPGGAALELRDDYVATEAAHMTTAYLPAVGALFTGDLAYRDVHLWLGVGTDRAAALGWQDTLDELGATWAPLAPTVYPGHGAPTDVTVFAADHAYIADVLAVADAGVDAATGTATLTAAYPGYANTDFLLMMSMANLAALRTP